MENQIVIVDNDDSFTMNLAESIFQISGALPKIINFREIIKHNFSQFSHIILSPGPGLPQDFKDNFQLLSEHFSTKKILGVCMGMQLIAVYFGCKLKNLDQPEHGTGSELFKIKDDVLFNHISFPCIVGRYHSWVIDPGFIPSDLCVTSELEDGTIMSIRHKIYDVCGVQFHPESIITVYGKTMLKNWLYS